MLSNAIECVAENQASLHVGVVKWLDAKMVAGTKKPLLWPVPNDKSKVADQALDTVIAPHVVRVQNKFHVGHRFLNLASFGPQMSNQIVGTINQNLSLRFDPGVALKTGSLFADADEEFGRLSADLQQPEKEKRA